MNRAVKTILVFVVAFAAVYALLNLRVVISWFTPESPEDKEAYYVELTNFYKEKYRDQNRLLVGGVLAQSSHTPIITPTSTASPTQSTAPKTKPNSLSIPKLGVQAPIVVSATTDEAQILKYLR